MGIVGILVKLTDLVHLSSALADLYGIHRPDVISSGPSHSPLNDGMMAFKDSEGNDVHTTAKYIFSHYMFIILVMLEDVKGRPDFFLVKKNRTLAIPWPHGRDLSVFWSLVVQNLGVVVVVQLEICPEESLRRT